MTPKVAQRQNTIAAVFIVSLAFIALSIPWWYVAADLFGQGSYGVMFAAIFVVAAATLVQWFAGTGRGSE